jgi:hypothetical protein
VRYLVASEELVPAHSWPYKEIYGTLRANPQMGGAEFAKLVVERYTHYYSANPPGGGDVTKVALDLGRIESPVQATDRLAVALRADMSKSGDALWQVQRSTEKRETREGKRSLNKFMYHLWDVGSLATGLAQAEAVSEAVKQAAATTLRTLVPGVSGVLAEGHRGEWFDGIGGVSIYMMPPGRQRISPAYSKLAFAKDTQWDEMLIAYHKQVT